MTIQLSCVRLSVVLVAFFGMRVGAQAPGKDPVDDAVEAFDKQIGIAKKQFDTSVQRSAETTVKRLTTLGENAARSKNDDFAARAFKEALRIDRNSSQARAFFQQRNKLDAVFTELTLEGHPLLLLAPDGREERAFYECMLGRYQSDRTWIAAVDDGDPGRWKYFQRDDSPARGGGNGRSQQWKVDELRRHRTFAGAGGWGVFVYGAGTLHQAQWTGVGRDS
jgi:hypothetical protein